MTGVVKQIDRQKEILALKSAAQFAFRSSIHSSMSDLNLLQQSLYMVETAMIGYLPLAEGEIAAGKLGWTLFNHVSSESSQAFYYQNEHDSVVAFRGKEIHQWSDLKSVPKASMTMAETVGKVHPIFKRQADELWPVLAEVLAENTKPLWFTGHSLGGALAIICASRCLVSHIKSEPAGIFTFGSPRVGNRAYVNYTSIPHFRWVNNNDIVTHLPPLWLGYRHDGRELYLDRFGNLREVTGWKRWSDRSLGLVHELRTQFKLDYLSDHSILAYIDHIARKVKSGRTCD